MNVNVDKNVALQSCLKHKTTARYKSQIYGRFFLLHVTHYINWLR